MTTCRTGSELMKAIFIVALSLTVAAGCTTGMKVDLLQEPAEFVSFAQSQLLSPQERAYLLSKAILQQMPSKNARLQVAKEILASGPIEYAPNRGFASGTFGPLHTAVEMTHRFDRRLIRLLLDDGANPNLVDLQNRNALHYAAGVRKLENGLKPFAGSEEAYQMIIEAGADESLEDKNGRTPKQVYIQNFIMPQAKASSSGDNAQLLMQAVQLGLKGARQEQVRQQAERQAIMQGEQQYQQGQQAARREQKTNAEQSYEQQMARFRRQTRSENTEYESVAMTGEGQSTASQASQPRLADQLIPEFDTFLITKTLPAGERPSSSSFSPEWTSIGGFTKLKGILTCTPEKSGSVHSGWRLQMLNEYPGQLVIHYKAEIQAANKFIYSSYSSANTQTATLNTGARQSLIDLPLSLTNRQCDEAAKARIRLTHINLR